MRAYLEMDQMSAYICLTPKKAVMNEGPKALPEHLRGWSVTFAGDGGDSMVLYGSLAELKALSDAFSGVLKQAEKEGCR